MKVFEPFKINQMELKNRMVVSQIDWSYQQWLQIIVMKMAF